MKVEEQPLSVLARVRRAECFIRSTKAHAVSLHLPPPLPLLYLLPACLGRFCLCIAVISHGWLGTTRVTEQVEDSYCEKALRLTFDEWMEGRISGARPCSRDHHGLLPDPGGEGHARLLSGRESWFFVGKTLQVLPFVCFAFLADCTGSAFASFPLLTLIGACRILSAPVVRNCALRVSLLEVGMPWF